MTEKKKSPRRARGDGSLFKRGDGMWVGRVELPPDVDGKRRYRYVSSKSFDLAAEKLRKLRNDVAEGRIAVTGNTTVAKWLDRWLNEIHVDKIRPTTRRDYQTTIDRHIVPAIGARKLDKLTVTHVRQMHTAIGKRRAAEKAHVVLKKALKDAVREGMLIDNVAERLDAPRYKRSRRTSLSVEVAQHIIGTAFQRHGDEMGTRWAAAFLTGARQSELLGLRWTHVDLVNGYMDISWQLQQLSQIHGCNDTCGRTRPGWCPQRRWDLPPDFEHIPLHRSLVLTRPKTAAGERSVPILPPLLAKLRELYDRQGPNPHDLVWHNANGQPIGPREDYRAWKQLLIDAKVIEPDQTLSMHTARHTTATLLRAAGVDEQTRMEILGHASVDAQRVYAHADRDRHTAAMANLGQLIAIETKPA